jgi:hypothetical protein
MVENAPFWQKYGDFYAPRFNLGTSSSYRREWWKAYGRILALHIIYYGLGPDPVSPFLLLALFSGEPRALVLSHRWIDSLDSSAASKLKEWLLLDPDADLPVQFSDELRTSVINFTDEDVIEAQFKIFQFDLSLRYIVL